MQLSPCQAVLIIADISGFTKFMKMHAITTSHAKQIIVALLESLVNASSPPLELAELEGDAAFFYAACREENGGVESTMASVKGQVMELFRAFYKKQLELDSLRMCICEACVGIPDLRLKVVMHTGEIEFQQIRSFLKLFGLDVILVHRLLKNSLRSKEYVLMTDTLFRQLGDFHDLKPEKRREELEGIGKVDTVVFYPTEEMLGTNGWRANSKPPPFSRKLKNWLMMDVVMILDLLGIRKLGESFENLPAKG